MLFMLIQVQLRFSLSGVLAQTKISYSLLNELAAWRNSIFGYKLRGRP